MVAPTEKLYLGDTYQFRFDGLARVVEVVPAVEEEQGEGGEKKKGTPMAIILDRSIFHPQGGGQPSDEGIIRRSGGGGRDFMVRMVKDVGGGVVYHYGSYRAEAGGGGGGGEEEEEEAVLAPGDLVDLEVDEGKRLLHARLHSAGHAIDMAVSLAGYGSLKATKGYHFADGPYVEYEGSIGGCDGATAFVNSVNERLQAIVQDDICTEVHVVSKGQAADMLGGEAEVKHLPDDKDVRVVVVGGGSCPCGGTHVRTTGELRGVEVTKVKAKKNTVRVSYRIALGE